MHRATWTRYVIYSCFRILNTIAAEFLTQQMQFLFNFQGLRLLSPRYDTHRMHQEYKRLIFPQIQSKLRLIPTLHGNDWQAIVAADYRRSLNESGPILFVEKGVSIFFAMCSI